MWRTISCLVGAIALSESYQTVTHQSAHQSDFEIEALDFDDACHGDDTATYSEITRCATSLRQLRARTARTSRGTAPDQGPISPSNENRDPVNEPVASATTADTEGFDTSGKEFPLTAVAGLGVPGGWGEAANYADDVKTELGNHSASLDPNVRGWGSCTIFGCPSVYVPRLGCQCNWGCAKHRSCCFDYSYACPHNHYHPHRHRNHDHHSPAPAPAPAPRPPNGNNLKTLYHNTSPEAGALILQNGFRPGKEGWCGGGIYFATSPEATKTKAIGPASHQGFMIAAQVDLGVVKYMKNTCDRSLTGEKVASQKFDSVSFDPGDGTEFVVYSNDRVISTKQMPI